MSASLIKLILLVNALYFAGMLVLTGNLLHTNAMPEQRPFSWSADWGAFCLVALLTILNILGLAGFTSAGRKLR